MKRIVSLFAAAALCLGLAACGAGASASGSAAQPKDYPAILQAARSQELNDSYVVFHLKDGAYTASGAYAGELSAEDIAMQGEMCLQMLGLTAEDVTEAVYSVSLMNVQSYGVAIVKPAEGKAQAVTDGLQTFIDGQKAAQENYLADQYAIAKAAKLETVPSGEVVLVMSEGQDEAFRSIKDALA